MPENLKGTYADYSHNFGFNWKEFVMTVPSPLLLLTTYKSNGLPNACMQSWATFTCANKGDGYYAILAVIFVLCVAVINLYTAFRHIR